MYEPPLNSMQLEIDFLFRMDSTMTTTHIPHRAGWLPADPDVMRRWYQHQIENLPIAETPWNDVITEFKNLIENDPEIYMGFSMMFEQLKNDSRPQVCYICFSYSIVQWLIHYSVEKAKNYTEMLNIFNELLHQAPDYATEKDWGGLIAFPFNVILNYPMATPAGIALFTHHKVNAMLKKMFSVWAVHLSGKKSRDVLNKTTGWFSPKGLEALAVRPFDKPDDKDAEIEFGKAFICDPSDEHYGFGSWDDFFIRDFRKGIRPVEAFDNNDVIVSACESDVYRIANNVQQRDRFWIKEQPYSLYHMLNGDPDYAKSFEGGIVYQAFLSAKGYHRWHAPVSGTVQKIVFVPGTYYSICPNADIDTDAPDKSQPYITQVSTRILIFIEADNKKIGLMCFIAVGMSECSTCQVTVQDNEHVDKGDEIGMFHFGGSTHCLVFRKEAPLKFVYNEGKLPYQPDPDQQPHSNLSRKIADVL